MQNLGRMLHGLQNQNGNRNAILVPNRNGREFLQIINIGVGDLEQQIVFLLFAQSGQDALDPERQVFDDVRVSQPGDERPDATLDVLIGRVIGVAEEPLGGLRDELEIKEMEDDSGRG